MDRKNILQPNLTDVNYEIRGRVKNLQGLIERQENERILTLHNLEVLDYEIENLKTRLKQYQTISAYVDSTWEPPTKNSPVSKKWAALEKEHTQLVEQN
jgi:hypothetical protein